MDNSSANQEEAPKTKPSNQREVSRLPPIKNKKKSSTHHKDSDRFYIPIDKVSKLKDSEKQVKFKQLLDNTEQKEGKVSKVDSKFQQLSVAKQPKVSRMKKESSCQPVKSIKEAKTTEKVPIEKDKNPQQTKDIETRPKNDSEKKDTENEAQKLPKLAQKPLPLSKSRKAETQPIISIGHDKLIRRRSDSSSGFKSAAEEEEILARSGMLNRRQVSEISIDMSVLMGRSRESLHATTCSTTATTPGPILGHTGIFPEF